MMNLTQKLPTFPTVTLPAPDGGLPVEVSLIAQLDPGAGDALITRTDMRQRGHQNFVDALDEPSARIGDTDFEKGDASSLYTFSVGQHGHPFHRHQGHRVFTAITGSGGTQLRFVMLPDSAMRSDPRAFLRAMRFVDLPPDCLFTVRFGGGTWHQFVPRPGTVGHPALFALSCHTNELGGQLTDELRGQVLANGADIPSLTETLPPAIQALLDDPTFDAARIPTTALALDKSAQQTCGVVGRFVRAQMGSWRSAVTRLRATAGLVSSNGAGRQVLPHRKMPVDSLAARQFAGHRVHEDAFELRLAADEIGTRSARALLASVLEGFLEHRPIGVAQLMRLRNFLVRPFRLRTSTIGCPVSSLLVDGSACRFNGLPVHESHVSSGDHLAEVVLGADDRHLAFRSVVRVEIRPDGSASVWLGTRVATRNLFGVVYMALIDIVHRRYISPAMLRLAVEHATRTVTARPFAPGAADSPGFAT